MTDIKLFIIWILVAGCFNVTYAQTYVLTTAWYKGSVGDYPVAMQLRQQRGNDTLDGSYYYLRNGREKSINLNGMSGHPTTLAEKVTVEKNGKYVWETTGQFSVTAPSLATGKLTGSWKNGKTGKRLPVQLQLLANAADAPLFYDYELVMHREKMINLSGQVDPLLKASALKIISEGKVLQTLSGFNEFIGAYAEVILEDLNFDGHFDIKIPIRFPDRTKYDAGFLYFIYQPAAKKFVKHQDLTDLEYLYFDPIKKEAHKYTAGASGFVIDCYKWRGSQLYLYRTEPADH